MLPDVGDRVGRLRDPVRLGDRHLVERNEDGALAVELRQDLVDAEVHRLVLALPLHPAHQVVGVARLRGQDDERADEDRRVRRLRRMVEPVALQRRLALQIRQVPHDVRSARLTVGGRSINLTFGREGGPCRATSIPQRTRSRPCSRRRSRQAPTARRSRTRTRRVTFRELRDRAGALARSLLAHDVGAGRRVGLFLPNCLEYIDALFAAALVGAQVVPINARFKRRELAHVVARSEIAILSHDLRGGRPRRLPRPRPRLPPGARRGRAGPARWRSRPRRTSVTWSCSARHARR